MAEHSEVRTITIPLREYDDLIRNAEKIAVVKRLCDNGQYISIEDVKAALGIN